MSRPQVVNVDCNFNYDLERRLVTAAGADLVLQRAKTEAEIITACANASVVLFENADTPFTAHVVDSLPACRAIVRYGVGVDSIDVPAATRQGIVVANTADYCTEEVSDHAVALLLASVRRIAFFDRSLHAGAWHGYSPGLAMRRVSQLTVGLLGWGRIAQATARKLAGFQSRLLVCDPFVKALPPGVNATLVDRETLLRESDLISLHLPLNSETRHLINDAALRLMKPTAVLINTSRGGIVDEAALIRALQEKRIGGAALDVFETEPLSPTSPLRSLESVVLTPHFAASSVDAMQHLQRTVAQSVAALVRGHYPPFVINPTVKPRTTLRPWAEFTAPT